MNIGLKEICTIVGVLVLGYLFVKGFMAEPHKDKKGGNNSSGGSGEIKVKDSSDGKL